MAARVLWLIKGLGLGGAERLLALAAPHLNRRDFSYEVAYLLPWKTALVRTLEEGGVPTVCLNHAAPFDPRIVARLIRFLRERQIDLLHLHLPYSGVVGRVAGRLAGVKGVIYTEHNLQERYHPLTRLANQLTLPLCHHTIAVSDEVAHSLRRSLFTRRAAVSVILNGIDVEAVQSAAATSSEVRRELGIAPDRLLVGVVIGFRPQKRPDLWVRAARMIADQEPRATFVLVGDGPSLAPTRALAAEVGLDGRAIFTGLRPDAPRLIAAFDLFMLSSMYEGLPVAVLEAMALGRPIVATRVGGLPGVIEHERSGLLVGAGDPAALAAEAVRVLADPALRQSLGTAAQQRVAQEFGIVPMVRATEALYRQVLERAGRGRRG